MNYNILINPFINIIKDKFNYTINHYDANEFINNSVNSLNLNNKILTKEEKSKLALDAMLVRAGIVPNSVKANKFEYDEETITDILEPKRDADKGDDLWKVFNVIQEKITQGEFHAALKGANTKVRKVRKIKSFEKDLEVNKKLFKLATALI